MSEPQKGLESPCQQVIEWRVNQPDCDTDEARKLQAIQHEGITEAEQAELLSSACQNSGMRERCQHADDC